MQPRRPGVFLVYALNPELLLGWNVSLSPSLEFILGSPARGTACPRDLGPGLQDHSPRPHRRSAA